MSARIRARQLAADLARNISQRVSQYRSPSQNRAAENRRYAIRIEQEQTNSVKLHTKPRRSLLDFK